ncbi:MAG TPA: ester cyclase [Eudoraea sp.]|nr:ester cyclase [Eudoraea sp.]
MKELQKKVSDLNSLILEGRSMDAFEKYYHEDVVMQENDQLPTVGKAANRLREEKFFAAVTEFRLAEVRKTAVGENISMVEWHFDYTHNEWGERNYSQIAVQEWRDSKIKKETFYYGN